MPKSNPSHQVVAGVRTRPGEGPTVNVTVHSVANVNGQTVQAMGIDLSTAPVPERKYLAETCDVRFHQSTVKLLFGQERIGKAELRSLLIIHMSASAVARFIASIGEVKPTFEELAAISGVQPQNGIPITEEPSQTVALGASVALTGSTNEDACIDFFGTSPFAMGAAVHTKKLALDPVVRVDLPTSLLLHLIRELRKLSPRLPKALAIGPQEDAK